MDDRDIKDGIEAGIEFGRVRMAGPSGVSVPADIVVKSDTRRGRLNSKGTEQVNLKRSNSERSYKLSAKVVASMTRRGKLSCRSGLECIDLPREKILLERIAKRKGSQGQRKTKELKTDKE